MLYYLKSVFIWLVFYSTINLTACKLTHKYLKALTRIVGGHNTDIWNHPHQVSIQVYNRHYCGGSLISDRYIITAGHCSSRNIRDYTVVLGVSNLHSYTNGVTRKVKNIINHPNYRSFWRGNLINDISIWELDKPVVFNAYVKPIQLPPENARLIPGEMVQVTGFGHTKEGGMLAKSLQVVDVQVIDRKYCKKFYNSRMYFVDDTMICAGVPEGGKSSCQGDSGGPLTARRQLYGLVSWGIGCARPGIPIVNTFVPKFRSFIKKHTGV